VLLDEDGTHDQDPSAPGGRAVTTERTDVVVVGLGPAGARAAAHAARRGVRVIGLDRRHEAGVPVQCAEFVPALIGIEVDALVRSVRQSIASMTTFVEDEPPEVTRPFPGHMLDRAAFDAALVDDASDAGARCRFGAGVRAIRRDGCVVLADGTAIEARVVVGADGPRSIVGRAVGRVNVALVETRQITVPLVRAHDATDIFLSTAIPGGYGWLFPKGAVANLGAGVAPAFKHRLKPIVDGLHATLVAQGRVGRDVLQRTGGAIPVGGMLEPCARLAGTSVLLAGDAAGLAHPVTGAGIAAAVYSGGLAGDAAAEIVAGSVRAADDYADELRVVLGSALERGLARRRELEEASRQGTADAAALRRGWIAYPAYWARHEEVHA
jgi:geranylgeranyl reductase family protein